ncbi:MAG: GNAT family N-acetyltransferase [Nitrospirota bacterium]
MKQRYETGNGCAVQRISDVPAWEVLKDSWNASLGCSKTPSVFLTYEFLSAAWSLAGPNAQLHILLVRHQGILIGIAPLMVISRRVLGLLSKTIQPIDRFLSERDFFILLGEETLFYEALATYLSKNRVWNKLFFPGLPEGHPFLHAMKKTFSASLGILLEEKKNLIHPSIILPSRWETYCSGLKPRFLKKLSGSIHELHKLGGIRVIGTSNPDMIRPYLEVYIQLEQRSWKGPLKSGITRTPDLLLFYQRMLTSCALHGWPEITFLTADSRVVAGSIQMIYRDEFFYLQTVHDESLKHYNPGMLLMTIQVWRACQKKLSCLHFMGGHHEYKRNWSTREWESYTLCIRERLSGEGLARLGSLVLKDPFAGLSEAGWKKRRKSFMMPEQDALEINPSLGQQAHVLLAEADLEKVFPDFRKNDTAVVIAHAFPMLSRAEIEQLIQERFNARKDCNWKRADEIRDQLARHGVLIRDTKTETRWEHRQADAAADDHFIPAA